MTEEKKSDQAERLKDFLKQLNEDFALRNRLEDEFGLYVADEEKCQDLRKAAEALSYMNGDCVPSPRSARTEEGPSAERVKSELTGPNEPIPVNSATRNATLFSSLPKGERE